MLRRGAAAATEDLDPGFLGVFGHEVEAGRKDQQSSGYSLPATTTPAGVIRSTPLPAGIDQGDVRAIEGLQKFVVKAEALAETDDTRA